LSHHSEGQNIFETNKNLEKIKELKRDNKAGTPTQHVKLKLH